MQHVSQPPAVAFARALHVAVPKVILHSDVARRLSGQASCELWCGWRDARTCAGGSAMALALTGWQH